MNYININKKKLVGRNNQICSSPIVLDYSTVEEISFQFINDQNQIQSISGLTGLYFAGSLGIGQQSYDLLFLSKDFTIENDVLTFNVDTYTRNYLDKIKKKNTEINIEIGLISVDTKRVLLRDYASAYPRVYVAGLSPQEIDSHDYYTKEEVDELIAGIELSGYATEEYVDEAVATKQDIIDADNKLSYALVSGAPTIPTKTSDLQNDSGFITDSALQGYATETYVNSSVSGKADKAELPTKLSQLQNDEGFIDADALSSYATEQYVTAAVSGKADASALIAHTSDTTIHVTAADKTTWNEKQDAITSDNKLDYALLSATPSIPLSTSQLTNDSGFVNGEALNGKQDTITEDNKLPYDLISGAPSGTTASWGEIIGTISAQTDLQAALDLKADKEQLDAVDEVLQTTIIRQLKRTPFYVEAAEANDVIKFAKHNYPDTIHLQYSTDLQTWYDYTVNTEITLQNVGDKAYFKGNDGYFSKNSSYYYLSSSMPINVGGNIVSLIDETMHTISIPEYTFGSMFNGQNIYKADRLLLLYISNYIYRNMFSNCTSLITPPVLSATSSAFQCYNNMFNGCTSLTKAPVILATSLSYNACNQMYMNCSSLTEITVHFTGWSSYTTDWVSGVAASGTFYCPAALGTNETIQRGTNRCPEGWTVVNI